MDAPQVESALGNQNQLGTFFAIKETEVVNADSTAACIHTNPLLTVPPLEALMFKIVLSSVMSFAIATPLFASSFRTYKFDTLSKLTAAELDRFNSDLPFALNELQNCPGESRDEIHFGSRIHSLEITSDRSGTDTVTIEGSGIRPMPSGRKYDVTIHLVSKIKNRPGSAPLDAPPLRSYVCTTEYK